MHMCKQYLSCTVKWRNCMSKSKCRRCKFVSKLRIHDHLYLNLLLYFLEYISHVCLFEFFTQIMKRRHQFSKFLFPPLNFLGQNVLWYNRNNHVVKNNPYYIYYFIYKHLYNMTLNLDIALLLSVSIYLLRSVITLWWIVLCVLCLLP